MSVYFIANIRITDNEGYKSYLKDSESVFSKFEGEYLAVDEAPELIEGQWKYTKTVLISFPNKAALKAWYYSDEYQRILEYRINFAECDSIIVEGLEK